MMTTSEATRLPRFVIDRRRGNNPRRCLVTEVEELMQIPGDIRNCVAFVCYKPRGSGKWNPAGTAFFLACDGFLYCITAKHVLDGVQRESSDGKLLLRVNMRAGGSDFMETDVSEWRVHPTEADTVDVAALYVDGRAGLDEVLFQPFDASMMLTDKVRTELNVRLGEDVFLVGMFFHHQGKRHMLPVIRTGTLAANREEPVWDDGMQDDIDAYLIETRSIGGLSGSPVFFYPGTHRWLLEPDGVTPESAIEQRPTAYWLGLIHGHWDVLLSQGVKTERMNTGMAMVVPAEKVIEVLKRDDFEAERSQARIEYEKRYGGVVLDTAINGDSAFSKDDFDSVLRKVSKRKKPSAPEQAS